MEDHLCWETTFAGRKMTSNIQMDFINEDDLKHKEDLHIAGRHTALDKIENNPKEDDHLRWNMTFDRRRLLTEDDL